ncbi:MAG: DivIVA domain-containing protein [Thermoleophilia bacterium]
MKLTPLDIRHKEFRRGMRGYSDEDVDLFLDEVADEFERLFQENIEMRERLEQFEEKVRHHESLKETLQKTLVSAQQQADGTRANARKEAELILKDAEIKGRDLLNESYGEKQRVQQALTQLKQVEEDFRFKFRSLLEAHLNLLSEDEVSEERKRFRGLVAGIQTGTQEERMSTPQRPAPAAAAAAGDPGVEGAPAASSVAAAPGDAVKPGSASAEPEPALDSHDVAPFSAPISAGPPVAEPVSPSPVTRPEETSGGPTEYARERRADPGSLPEFGDDDPETLGSAYDGLEPDEGRRGERGNRKDSPVRRFLFGRKETGSDGESDFFDDSEDRDFHW